MDQVSKYSLALDLKHLDNVLLVGGNKNNFYNLNTIVNSIDYILKKNQLKNHILSQRKYSRIIINDSIFTSKKRLADIFLLNNGLVCMFGLNNYEFAEIESYINNDIDYYRYNTWMYNTNMGKCLVTDAKIC